MGILLSQFSSEYSPAPIFAITIRLHDLIVTAVVVLDVMAISLHNSIKLSHHVKIRRSRFIVSEEMDFMWTTIEHYVIIVKQTK